MTGCGITTINCACIAIAAVTQYIHAPHVRVACLRGTRVIIFAVNGGVNTSTIYVTGIGGALIVIIAGEWSIVASSRWNAGVISAVTIVVAHNWSFNYAAIHGVTLVDSTHISILAIDWGEFTGAGSWDTFIVGTSFAVVAYFKLVDTPNGLIAGIDSAKVCVSAVYWSKNTSYFGVTCINCAFILVITWGDWGVGTTIYWVALTVGAKIIIITRFGNKRAGASSGIA